MIGTAFLKAPLLGCVLRDDSGDRLSIVGPDLYLLDASGHRLLAFDRRGVPRPLARRNTAGPRYNSTDGCLYSRTVKTRYKI